MRLTEAYVRGANELAGSEVVVGKVEGIALDSDAKSRVSCRRRDDNGGRRRRGDGAVDGVRRDMGLGAIPLPQIYGQVSRRFDEAGTGVIAGCFPRIGRPNFILDQTASVRVWISRPTGYRPRIQAPWRCDHRRFNVSWTSRRYRRRWWRQRVNGSGQSCHLPVTADGTPVMGAVPGVKVVVAPGTRVGASSTRRRAARRWQNSSSTER